MHAKTMAIRKLILALLLLITEVAFSNGVSGIATAQAPATALDLLSPAQVATTGGLYLSTRSRHSENDVEPARLMNVTPEGVTSTLYTFPDNPTGGFLYGELAFSVSHDLAFDTSGNLFIAYSHVNRIDKIAPEGAMTTFATGLVSPHGLAFDGSGDLYVSTRSMHGESGELLQPARIMKVTPEGAISIFLTFPDNPTGGFLYGGLAFSASHDLAFDTSGNLFIAYSHLNRIDKIAPEGAMTTFATGLVSPHGLAFTEPHISHIEISQATQTITNTVPLIAQKPTFVRVYVDCGAICASLRNVTGVLRGHGPSGLLPHSPLSPVNRSITAYHEDWRNQRGYLEKTLNFTLPPEWRTETITLTAEVSGAVLSGTATLTTTFQLGETPSIVYVRIRYRGQSPDLSRVQTGSWWAYRIYPTARITYVPGTTLDWSRCLETSPLCPLRDSNIESLLSELTRRSRLVDAYVYGWLPEGSFGGGISDPAWPPVNGSGRAAFGDDHPTQGARIFAHEIAHLMGRRHTNTGECLDLDPNTDWPYATARIQDYGLDGYGFDWQISSSRAVKNPANIWDYMSYCGSLANGDVWTSPWTYERIYLETLRPQTTTMAARPLFTPQPYFIASGLIYTDDTANLDPIWVITSTVAPANPPQGTQYCLEAQGASDAPLASRCFDLSFVNYESGQDTDVDGFSLMLPCPSDVARFVLKKGSLELAVQPVSANAPSVAVLSPNGGENWLATGTYTVTWMASDGDGDALSYSVFYSPEGSDLVPVGAVITQTQLAINAAELAGSSNARIRVIASDGANTSADESDEVFTVGQKPPSVQVLSPRGSATIPPGTPVWLRGYAYDLEDGVLQENALQWSSSRDGTLATGSEVLVSLSPGQHIVRLTARDTDSTSATATISVLIGYDIYLPIVLRSSP